MSTSTTFSKVGSAGTGGGSAIQDCGSVKRDGETLRDFWARREAGATAPSPCLASSLLKQPSPESNRDGSKANLQPCPSPSDDVGSPRTAAVSLSVITPDGALRPTWFHRAAAHAGSTGIIAEEASSCHAVSKGTTEEDTSVLDTCKSQRRGMGSTAFFPKTSPSPRTKVFSVTDKTEWKRATSKWTTVGEVRATHDAASSASVPPGGDSKKQPQQQQQMDSLSDGVATKSFSGATTRGPPTISHDSVVVDRVLALLPQDSNHSLSSSTATGEVEGRVSSSRQLRTSDDDNGGCDVASPDSCFPARKLSFECGSDGSGASSSSSTEILWKTAEQQQQRQQRQHVACSKKLGVSELSSSPSKNCAATDAAPAHEAVVNAATKLGNQAHSASPLSSPSMESSSPSDFAGHQNKDDGGDKEALQSWLRRANNKCPEEKGGHDGGSDGVNNSNVAASSGETSSVSASRANPVRKNLPCTKTDDQKQHSGNGEKKESNAASKNPRTSPSFVARRGRFENRSRAVARSESVSPTNVRLRQQQRRGSVSEAVGVTSVSQALQPEPSEDATVKQLADVTERPKGVTSATVAESSISSTSSDAQSYYSRVSEAALLIQHRMNRNRLKVAGVALMTTTTTPVDNHCPLDEREFDDDDRATTASAATILHGNKNVPLPRAGRDVSIDDRSTDNLNASLSSLPSSSSNELTKKALANPEREHLQFLAHHMGLSPSKFAVSPTGAADNISNSNNGSHLSEESPSTEESANDAVTPSRNGTSVSASKSPNHVGAPLHDFQHKFQNHLTNARGGGTCNDTVKARIIAKENAASGIQEGRGVDQEIPNETKNNISAASAVVVTSASASSKETSDNAFGSPTRVITPTTGGGGASPRSFVSSSSVSSYSSASAQSSLFTARSNNDDSFCATPCRIMTDNQQQGHIDTDDFFEFIRSSFLGMCLPEPLIPDRSPTR